MCCPPLHDPHQRGTTNLCHYYCMFFKLFHCLYDQIDLCFITLRARNCELQCFFVIHNLFYFNLISFDMPGKVESVPIRITRDGLSGGHEMQNMEA